MKTTLAKALVSFLALCAGALAFTAWAATPVAVWDGDFGTLTKNGVTLRLGAHTRAADSSSVMLKAGQTNGIGVEWGTPKGAVSIIYRCTNVPMEPSTTYSQVFCTIGRASSTNRVGAVRTTGDQYQGIWANALWSSSPKVDYEEGTAFALCYQYNSGTRFDVKVGDAWKTIIDRSDWGSPTYDNNSLVCAAVGGYNGASGSMSCLAGAVITSIAVFHEKLTAADVAAFSFPSELSGENGVIWGNMGTSKSDPGSCTNNKKTTLASEALTLNFSKADGMSQKGIKGDGKVKITKIRFARGSNSASVPKTLTLSQAGAGAIISTGAVLQTGQKLWWANKSEKSVAVFEYTFGSGVQFDTDKDVSLNFSSKASLYVIEPKNSVLSIDDYSPTIEVTGDWTPTRQIAINIAQYWNGSTGSTTTSPTIAGQVTTDQATLVGTVPAAVWAQPSVGNIPVTENSGRRFTFGVPNYMQGAEVVANPAATKVAAYFSAGTNLKVANSFGTGTFRNYFLSAQSGNVGNGDITVSDIPFSAYDAIIYMSADSTDAMNPISVNGKYLYPTAVEGVNKAAASATSPQWGNGKTAELTYGANVMRVNALSGRLTILHTAKTWGIAAVQLVERQLVTYTADVSADTPFDDISWTPAKPAEGFSAGDNLVINASGTPTITFGSAIETEASLTIRGAAKVGAGDDIYEDGCFVKAFATFARLTADAVSFADIKTGYVGVYAKTETGFALRAQNKEVVSINFAAGSSVSGTGYTGLAPVQGDTWNNLTNTWGVRSTKTLEPILASADGVAATESPYMALAASANNTHQWNAATDVFLKGYLDDGGQASVTVSGVPYATYDVIVYAATDEAGKAFRAVTVNGASYTYDADNPATAKTGTENWGASQGLVAEYGRNALRIRNLTGTELTIRGGTNGDGARGCIAAIQIVCTGAMISGTDYFAETTAGGDVSKLAWTPGPLASGPLNTATVTVGAGATEPLVFNFDFGLTLFGFAVVNAAGQAVTLMKAAAVTPVVGTYDFSGATGRVEMAFATGAAKVIAGSDTVLPAGGTGRLTIDAGKTATVMDGDWGGTVDWTADDAALRLRGAAMASVPYLAATAGKVIYALPFADQTSADGVQFAGTLRRDFEEGFALRTTRLVLGNNGGSVQNFVQKGGNLTVTGATGPGSTGASTLLAHYSSTVSYRLEAGALHGLGHLPCTFGFFHLFEFPTEV